MRHAADFRLLGEPRLFAADGLVLKLPTAKTFATLAIVLAAGSKGIGRQTIGDMLWSRSNEQQARTNLRQALSALRKSLGDLAGNLEQRGDVLWFRRDEVTLDIDLVANSQTPLNEHELQILCDAGEFMQGYSLKEAPFEEWLHEHRARINRLMQDRLESACEGFLGAGDFSGAERVSRKLIALDNFNEAAHRARMRALEGSGEVAAALKHFDELSRLLDRELAVTAAPKTLELARKLRMPERKPPQSEPEPEANRPPAQSGKDEDVAATPTQTQPPELRNVVVVALDISEDDTADQHVASRFDDIEDMSVRLSRLLQDFRGTELSNNGTSLLAVFGYPVAHSKDGERGVGFGRSALAEILTKMPGAVVRIAIVSGVVLARSEERANVLGDPVRRAQAQIHKTPEGRISADRGIFRATGNVATYEAEAESLWCLAPETQGKAERRPEFVGRDRELRQVLELLEDVEQEGRGEVVVLRGEAGIGKTRLSNEIAARAGDLGFEVSSCRVLDFGQGQKDNSLLMIAQALKAEAPAQMNRIEQAIWTDLTEPESLPEDARKMILELDAVSLLAEQNRMLQRVARDKSGDHPCLLIVEDVHWANPNLMKSLADMAASIADLPMVVAFTTRPENDPIDGSWRQRAGKTKTTTIDLRALRRTAALNLARNLRDLDEDLLQRCLERADGNPLFIEQLVLWAEEQSETNLPLSVQSVAQERLDKLSEPARNLARAACVLGQVFTADALAAVYGQEIGSALELDEAHIIVRREDSFSFVHALVRDGIYASLSPDTRKKLHTRASRFFATGDPVLAARHLFWSGADDAWVVCCDTAARERGAGRLEAAHELAEMALDACTEPKETPRILVMLGEIKRDREMFADATKTFLRVETEDEELSLRALVGAVESQYRLDSHDEAELLLREAGKIRLASNDDTWRTMMACLHSGLDFTRGNSHGAIDHARQAVMASENLDDKKLRARVMSTLADAEWMDGLFQSAETHYRECVENCHATGLRRYGLSHQVIVGMLRFYDAEFDDAERIMTETVEEARSINFFRAQMNGEHMLVYINSARAEYEAARAHWERARHLIETSSAKRFIMNSGCYAAQVMGPLGEIGPLMDYLRQSEKMAEELGLVWVLPWVLASRARWTDDPTEAAQALDRAEKLVFSGQTVFPFDFYDVGIDAAIRLEDWRRVTTYADRLDEFHAREPIGLQRFLSAKARAIAAAGRGEGDEAELRRLIALAEELGANKAGVMLGTALDTFIPEA